MNRRCFLKQAAAASLAATIVPARTAFGTQANSAIRVGMIGCGGRGAAVLTAMLKNTESRLVALADLFDDKLQLAQERFNPLCRSLGRPEVEKSHIFRGSQAYLRLLEQKDVDVALISTPAYAHPEFLEAAASAGKHIYCEKPLAVDVAGIQQARRAARKVKGRLSIAMGFQVRYASPYVEMVKRIQQGDIGEIINVQLYYLSSTSRLTSPPNVTEDEARIRTHYWYTSLSGGILLDQAIHLLDFAGGVLQGHPLTATGFGNRRGRNDPGDVMSNNQVVYEYPNSVNLALQSSQIGPEWSDVCMRFLGSRGFAEAHYEGGVFIKGEKPWDSGISRDTSKKPTAEEKAAGVFKSALDDADANKAKSFISGIQSGAFLNEVESGAQSTLTAILGRESALTGRKMSWEEIALSSQRLDSELDLTKF